MEGCNPSAREFSEDLGLWDVSACRSMAYMFFWATAFDGGVARWDVSACESMACMFEGAKAFSGGVAGWDVSACEDMEDMFRFATAFSGTVAKHTPRSTRKKICEAHAAKHAPWYKP